MQNRREFRVLLSEKFGNKSLSIKTKWKDFAFCIQTDSRYTNLVGQPGSTPKELFDDFIQAEKENFKRQKGTLKQIIKTSGISLTSQMSFQVFDSKLIEYKEYAEIGIEYRKFLHQYVMMKVKEK